MPELAITSRLSEDDWHNVTDPKKRKKIQDKLAQRARRKRLREGRQIPQPTSQQGQEKASHASNMNAYQYDAFGSNAPVDLPNRLDLMPRLEELTIAPPLCRKCSSQITAAGPALDIGYEPCPSMTVISAMYINGAIIGLKSCTVIPQTSSPTGPDVPISLQPTFLQLTTIHQPGIDRFPFPKMRDNMISMHTMIDEEDFTHDLCTRPSFTISPGMAPWDPKAWKIETYFAAKWGFLFY
ncbi:hypothetical protein A1O7_07255 [Cladophialophora yegresii CBS 114405]|uniref:BZIP domain-containing protein n=1 Tax=Cladophialophora yegresii CBS 114405 TaxID=1182544 RepID=W9VXF9_9EURO|nr:uncharacterized protein A1O7_07255 [Cladophialophora yegresii CBS 114405]EXJ56911.1 hypothetical protein A1O7_07255 [Cladophialophora yegresii CBS 114405]